MPAVRSRLTGRNSEGHKEEDRCESSSCAGSAWSPRSRSRCPGAFGGAGPDTRRHSEVDHHRRDVPAHRAGGGVRADPARDEGVLQLHQRPQGAGRQARRHGPADHLQVLRRRLQPGEHGPAHAPARRAGQGLRDGRPARHRAELAVARLPEPAEGAADARLDRARRTGARSTRSSRGRSAGSPTTSPRVASTGSTSRRTSTARRSRSSTRTTTTARTTSTGSARRSARRTPTPTSSPRRRSRRRRRASPSQMTRIRASGAHDPRRSSQLPTPTIRDVSRRARLSASTPSRST